MAKVRILILALLPAAILWGQVHRHGRFEHAFESTKSYENPVADVRVVVEFTGPGGVFHPNSGGSGVNLGCSTFVHYGFQLLRSSPVG